MQQPGTEPNLTSYLLGDRSELRPLLEAIADATDPFDRQLVASEYLLVLAAARFAASGDPPEERALAQIRTRYRHIFSGSRNEHARVLGALHAALKSGSFSEVLTALNLLGLYHRRQGGYRLARASFAVSVELAKRFSDPIEQLNSLFWLGVSERYLGHLDAAERVHAEQLRLARKTGQAGQAVLAQENLGLVVLRRGQVAEARKRVIRALTEAQDLDDSELQGYCYHALMVVEIEAGRPGEAAACGWEAYRRYESVDLRLRALRDCGAVFLEAGIYEPARAAYEIVLREASDSALRIHARTDLAELTAAVGDYEEFGLIASELLSEPNLAQLPYEAITAFRAIGLGYAAMGDRTRARFHLRKSLELAESSGFEAEAAEVRRRLESLPELGDAFVAYQPGETELVRLEDIGRHVLAERARKIA